MRLSPSSMARADACQYWLREDVAIVQSESSAAATLGTQAHARVERKLTGRQAGVVDSPEADALFAVWLDWATPWLGSVVVRAEVAIAWDPFAETARSLGDDGMSREARIAALNPGEMGMSMDMLVLSEGYAEITDWKTGQQTDLPHAQDNKQLAVYAAAVAKLFSVDRVVVRIAHITLDGVFCTEHTYESWDLAIEIPTMVRGILAAAPTAQPKPGSHCRWCVALGAGCPGPGQAIAALVPSESNSVVVQAGALPITAANAANVYDALKSMRELLDEVETGLHKFVDLAGPLTLNNGKRLVLAKETRESIVYDAACAAILTEYGVHDDVVDKTVTVTKTAISRAAGDKKDEIISALRAKGCTRAKEITAYRERK